MGRGDGTYELTPSDKTESTIPFHSQDQDLQYDVSSPM